MKHELLARISHEIRTPLNAVSTWTQLLLEMEDCPENVKEGLTVILQAAEAQTKLIDDLLDTTRIASGKMRLNPQACDLCEVIRSAVALVDTTARVKGMQITATFDPPEKPCPIHADPYRLQQVFWNLLSNAVKFGGAQGAIQIALRRMPSHVTIAVTDNGRGIESSLLPTVFDKFWQADSASPRTQVGLGLGLPIVKRIVELHGGTVCAESAGYGRGATFTVTLPLTE